MQAIRRACKAVLVAVVSHFDTVDEIGFCLALLLLSYGTWQVWRPGAALVPGAVLLWLYLPQRTSFVAKPRPIVKRDDE
jgi:hypothetical protein